MDWEDNKKRDSCSRGFGTNRHCDGRFFTAQLPPLVHYITSKSNTQASDVSSVSSIPTWRMPTQQPIQREAIQEIDYKESGQCDAEDEEVMITSRPKQAAKSSRYLQEDERRAIVLRICKGEKQSDLAREFKVTRAAVSYLNKHRNEVLARTHTDPRAGHPNMPRQAVRRVDTPPSPDLEATNFGLPSLTALLLPILPQEIRSSRQAPALQPAEHHPKFVREIKTRSMELLLSKIQDITTPPAEFQRNINRMMRLLAEEALASVVVVPVDVLIGRNEFVGGYSIANPTCAISMMVAACPMLSILNQLEPDLPNGYARVHRVHQSFCSNMLSVDLISSNLPPTLKGHNMFLVDLVSSSGRQVCAVIGKLLECGASTSLVTVVSLFSYCDTIATVHDQFPSVRFLVVQVDPPMNTWSA